MKYAVEMGSVAMTYKSTFVKIRSGIQTHRQHGGRMSLF
jgi:hypothetical protein